jgi:hypothetical protein
MGRLKWFVRDKFARPLIISDDPVTFKGRLHEKDCLIALPISPYQVFFAVSDDGIRDRILSEGDKSAATRINHDQALQAQRLVVGDVEPCFLEKRLRKQPEPYAPTSVSSRRDVQ